MEEEILATLKGLAEPIEDGEEHSVFRQGEQDTLVILGSNNGTGGRGEGSEGGGGGDEPPDSELEALDSEREEVDEEEKEMVDPNLEWMAQGPLSLPAVLHKMLK